METAVDTGSRQSAALPSINYLDIEKIKREEAEYQRKHSSPAMVSPSYPYSCPPPPYSNHSTTAGAVTAISGLISPPESRRTSENEKDPRSQPARQSLPSIHEALGADPPLPYSSAAPTPSTSAGSYFPPPAASSPSDPPARPFASEPQNPPPPPFTSQPASRSPYMGGPTSVAPAPQLPPAQPDPLPRPSFSSPSTTKLPTLHPLRTAQSPVGSSRPSLAYPYPQQQSPQYDSTPQSAGPTSQPFGYSPFPPPSYPYSAPPPGSAPPYPPSATFSAPPRYPPPAWGRSDPTDLRVEESKRMGRVTAFSYGESVKRHLDSFDLEASLHEILETTRHMMDFATVYGQRAHQTQRSGPVPGSIPTLHEVDELMRKGSRMQECLARIREVVVTHQAAVAEQEQDPRFKETNGYGIGDANHYQDETKTGGFAGADPKKRRGRAAPPGRCHSCNRAETPEWRRGPDGARTLCNACGLHYAKLTRKMGTNKAAIGSSNLRPKAMGAGSPAS